MVNKFGIDHSVAGLIPALLPFGTIILTPLFGNLYDRKGKGATIMIIGAILLIIVHTMFYHPVTEQAMDALQFPYNGSRYRIFTCAISNVAFGTENNT